MKALELLLLAFLSMTASRAFATTVEIDVNGLVCAFCAQGIEKTLRKFPATDDVFVSLEHRIVALHLKDGADIDDAALRSAITDAGYAVVAIRRSEESLDMLRARAAGGGDHG
jgi:copper chaperone CopZ